MHKMFVLITLTILSVLFSNSIYCVSKIIPLKPIYLLSKPDKNTKNPYLLLLQNEYTKSLRELDQSKVRTALSNYQNIYIRTLNYYNLAIFYYEINEINKRVFPSYIESLIMSDIKNKAVLPHFFNTVYLMGLKSKDRLLEALNSFNNFKKQIRGKPNFYRYYYLSSLYEGYILGRLNKKQLTREIWEKTWNSYISRLPTKSIGYLEMVSELLILSIRLNIRPPKINDSPSFLKNMNINDSFDIHIARNLAWLFCYNKQFTKAIKVLKNMKIQRNHYSEHPEKNKEILFHHPQLYKDLASIYFKLTGYFAQKLIMDSVPPEIQQQALFLLGEIAYLTGNIELSTYYLKQIPTTHHLGVQSQIYLYLASLINKPKTLQSKKDLRKLLTKFPPNSYHFLFLLKQITKRYFNDILSPEELTATYNYLLHSKTPTSKEVLYELGSLLLVKKLDKKALFVFEQLRNKKFPADIRRNHPIYLTSLASAYLRNNKYSSSLDILFELGTHFQEITHLQNYIQGLYSNHEKGSGQVLIQ